MRKFLVFLIAFIVVAVIAAFQLPGLLKKEIEKRIIAELDNTIRADFSFQKFDLSSINDFPHISIQMENFLVQGIDNFKGDTLAYSKKVILLFDFWNVYNTQKLDIKGIYLIEPDIRLVVERDSSANFDIFHSAKTNPDIKDSSHFNLMIEKWQIGKGKIEYRDKIESNHIVLDGINHTGKGSFTELVDDLITRTSIIEATVRWRNVKYIHKKPINLDLIVDMNFKDSIFTIKENKASIGHFSFGFEGRFKKISNLYHSDVKFNIKETNFKEILTLLPGVYKKSVEEYHAKGDVAFTGHLNGKFDPVKSQWPGFSAKLVVQNGEIRHPELKASITGINLHLLVENKLGLPDSTNFL
ncbi:MAG: hypothetical protein SFY32_05975, partial [Bacteroidota bacterium]|nr:hypothetical protein [Bacteroidota bacterium]